MDSGKQTSKNSARKSSSQQNDLASLQQQMALAAQFGMVPGANLSDVDIQRLLTMQASSLPFLDPGAALHAFGGIGGLPMAGMSPSLMMPGNMAAGGNDWLAMAQQAQLFPGFGGAVPPQLLSQLYASDTLTGQSNASTESSKSGVINVKKELCPHSLASRSPGQSAPVQKVSSRPNSNASSSRLTPSGVLSPGLSSSGRPSSKPRPQSSTPSAVIKETKLLDTSDIKIKKPTSADQMLENEMLNQFKQHLLLQQMQIKQQEQFQATVKALQQQQRGANKQRQPNSSQSEKLQEHISQSIYQQLLSNNPFLPGVPPAINSYFATQQIMDQMMNLNQSPNSLKEKSSGGKQFSSVSGNTSSSTSRDVEKQIQSSRSSNQNKASSKRANFPLDLSEATNPFLYTGDPNTDMYLAALYSQLQGQDGSAAKAEKNNKSIPRKTRDPSPDKKAFLNSSPSFQRQPSRSPKTKEVSSTANPESAPHRRKQANPVSISSIQESFSKSSDDVIMGGSPNLAKPAPGKCENLPDESSNDPSSLTSSRAKTISAEKKIPTEKISSAKNNFLNSKDEGRIRQLNSKSSSKPEENLNEKDIILAMQAMSKNANKSGSSSSTDQMDQLLVSVYNKFLKSGEGLDINKMNELLTATVAAEMKRLQVQKVNLTRELEMLNKNGNLVQQALAPYRNDRSFSSGSQQDVKYPRKRRRIISDEEEVMEPLRQGWKREIKCRRVGNQTRGEVFYHTPEGKKLRTYPDVLKYLEERKIETLHRNNFSFSSRLKIGTFYEQKGDSKQWTKIPEAEIDRHLGSFEHDDSSHSASASDDNQPPSNARRKRQTKTPSDDLSLQQVIEDNLRKDEENKAAKLADAELKMQERERKKLEQLQREIKERQIMEDRRKLEAARQLAKYQEAVRKEKEREERRRQLEFIKIMETKRRAEERDRRKEEIKNERMYIREKKMQQRRLAMKLARELKMPVEDMCLNNHQPLPGMQCLQRCYEGDTTQLNGESTADVLMVLEFLLTFKDAISISDDIIPTFEQLQRGLLNDPNHVEALVKLTMALLHQCLCDPGVPAPGPWLHCVIGIKVTDLDVTKENYSEILRLFLWARNGGKYEITDLLETKPFPSLSADHKAAVLATLVNELVCSRPVCEEIDKHLDNLATLRRDKWIVEGKIRQVRIEHANDGSEPVSLNSPSKPRPKLKQRNDDEEDDKTEKEDSSKDDDSVTGDNKPICRSDTAMERKMKILTKEHQSFNERLFSSSKPLRSLEMGQDRYRRRYWLLSHLGGIYVEGLESGGWYDNEDYPEEDSQDKTNHTEEKSEFTGAESKESIPSSSTPAPSDQQPCATDSISISNETVKAVTSSDIPNKLNSREAFLSSSSSLMVAFTASNHVTHPVTSSTTSICDLTKRPGASSQNLSLTGVATSVSTNVNDVTSTSTSATKQVAAISFDPTSICAQSSDASANLSNQSVVCDPAAPASTPSKRDETEPLPIDRSKTPPLIVNNQVNELSTTVDSTNTSSPKTNNRLPPAPSQRPVEEDEVEAAAKAIAAKAVAASSHLLYPQSKMGNSPSSSEKFFPSSNVDKNEISQASSIDSQKSVHELGKHITETLRSMGKNMNKLSEHQIQTLLNINKTSSDSSDHCNLIKAIASSTSFSATSSSQQLNSNPMLASEDAPMDLSKPSNNLSSIPSPSVSSSAPLMRSIKTEPLSFEAGFNAAFFGPSMTSHVNSMIKSEPSKVTSPEIQEMKANDVNKNPEPIPEEMKLGWWRVSSEEEFEELCSTLHCRGIREKHLHRSATKHRNYCLQAIKQANAPEFQFFVNSKTNKEEKQNCSELDANNKTTEADVEDKIDEVGLILENDSKTAFDIEVKLVEQVEDLISRCLAAAVLKEDTEAFPKSSEHRDQLSHVPYDYDDNEVARHDWFNPIAHDPKSALGFAVELVRKLEQSLLRSYLKPPLVRKGGSSEFSNLPSLSESGALDVAAGLKTWRNAVATATSAAQLSMCVTMLDSCINWQRAPNALDKVELSPKSKKKRLGGKSPGASSGKKKKKTVENVVDSEDSMSSTRHHAEDAEDTFKTADAEMRIEENSINASCSSPMGQDEDSIMQLDEQSEPSDKEQTLNNVDQSSVSSEDKLNLILDQDEKVKKKKKKKKSKEDKPKKKKSLAGACKEILRHLQGHEKAAWFLFPVDIKAVPDYRKIIKKPMDFNTIENRLRRKKYKMALQFADDVRTVFDNCQIFNEDDSPIGEAGHALRAVFEDKWTQLESSMDLQEPIG